MKLLILFAVFLPVNVVIPTKVHTEDKFSRIIGGSLAVPGQFPYQVFLNIVKQNISGYFCGGSIISPEWILTAVHCVYGATNVSIIAGSVTLDPVDNNTQIRVVTQIISHSEYNSKFNNDISLLKLSSPLKFDNYISAVPLPRTFKAGNNLQGQIVIASGWGRTADKKPDKPENILHFTNLYIENQETCKKSYWTGFVFDGVICVNTVGGTKGMCNGDSGGPLVLKSSGHLVGIASFGRINHFQSGDPHGFVRVSYYLDWIANYTGIEIGFQSK